MSEGRKLEAQGLLEKAMTAYASERDWEGAVRLAMKLNRHVDAARYCLQAQRPCMKCDDMLSSEVPSVWATRIACTHASRYRAEVGVT